MYLMHMLPIYANRSTHSAHTPHHVCEWQIPVPPPSPAPHLVCDRVLGDVSQCERTDDVAVALSGEEELLRRTEEEITQT